MTVKDILDPLTYINFSFSYFLSMVDEPILHFDYDGYGHDICHAVCSSPFHQMF